MEAKEYIENRVNVKIREYQIKADHNKHVHIAMMISLTSCILCSIVLCVLYFILKIDWLVFAGVVTSLSGLFLLLFDQLCQFEKKSILYQYQANALGFDVSIYLSKEDGFLSFASNCEHHMLDD